MLGLTGNGNLKKNAESAAHFANYLLLTSVFREITLTQFVIMSISQIFLYELTSYALRCDGSLYVQINVIFAYR